MSMQLNLNGAGKILERFWKDQRGGVPIEVIALTGSLALLGVTVMETQNTGVPTQGAEASEEVFVRKCGQRVAGGDDTPLLPQIGSTRACK